MAANKTFTMLLDILVNMKGDKSEVERFIKDVETQTTFSPDLKIDASGAKAIIQQLGAAFGGLEDDVKGIDKLMDGLELNIETDEAQKAFQEIEDMLENIDKMDLNQLSKAMDKLTDAGLEKASKEIKKYFDNFDSQKIDKSVKKLSTEYDKINNETKQLVDEQRKALAVLKVTGQTGSDAYNKIEKELKDNIALLVKYDQAMVSINAGNEKLKNSKTLGDKMASFGMITQGVDQITSSLNQFNEPFVELDKQVRNVGTLGVKNFQAFADAATDLSKQMPDTAGDIVGGIYDAISAGTVQVKDGMADVEGGMQFIEKTAKLATAGLTSTQDAVNVTTSIMNAYKKNVSETGYVTDTLLSIVRQGKTTVPELAASLSQVTPNAAATKVEFDQLGGALATMTKQGVPTAQATTKLNALLIELQKPGAKLIPILDKVGFSLESLEKEGLQESLRKIGLGMEDMGISAAQVFSSSEAASAAMLLSGENAAMAAADYDAVKNSLGATEEAFAVAADGIEVKTKKLQNSIQAVFNGIMDAGGPILQVGLNMAEKLAPMITSVAGIGYVMGSAIPAVNKLAVSLIGKLVPSLVTTETVNGQVVKSIKLSTLVTYLHEKAVSALNKVMKMNPWGLAIAGAAAIAAAYFALKDSALDAAEAQRNLVEGQININDRNIEQTNNLIKQKEGNLQLIDTYKELADKENLTEAEHQKLIQTTRELNKIYPNAQVSTDNFALSIAALKKEAFGTNEEIQELQDKLKDLENRKINLGAKKSWADVKVLREELNELLDDAGSGLTGNLFETIGSFESKEVGANLQKAYNEMLNSVDKNELQSKVTELQNLLYDSKFFSEGLDPEDQKEIIAKIEEFEKNKIAAFEAEEAKYQKLVENNIGQTLSAYQTATAEIAKIKEAQDEGIITDKQKQDLAQWEKSRQKYLNDILSNTKKLGKTNEEQVNLVKRMAADYGLSNDEVVKIYENLGTSEAKAEVFKLRVAEVNQKIINATASAKDMKDEISDNDEAINALKAMGIEFDNIWDMATSIGGFMDKLALKAAEAAKQAEKEKKENTKSNKARKTAIQLIKERYDAKKKVLDNELKEQKLNTEQFILGIKQKAIDEDRKLSREEELSIKKAELALAEKEHEYQNKYLEALSDARKNKKGIDITLKGPQLEEYKALELGIKEGLQNSSKNIQGIKVQINTDADTIKEGLKAIDKEIEDYNIQKITMEVESGSADPAELNRITAIYRKRLAAARSSLSELGDLDSLVKEEDRRRWLELQTEIMDIEKGITDNEAAQYQIRLDKIEEFHDKRIDETEKDYDRRINILQRFNDAYYNATEKIRDESLDKEISQLDDTESAKITALEEWKDQELITEDDYNNRKLRLEEEFEAKRELLEKKHQERLAVLKATQLGSEKYAEMEKNRDLLSLNKDAAEERLKAFIDSNKHIQDTEGHLIFNNAKAQEEYEQLKQAFSDASSTYENQATILGVAGEQLGETMTDFSANVFAWDTEAMMNNAREYLAFIGGLIKKQAEAAILTVLFSDGVQTWLATNLAATPFLIPAAEALIYGIIRGGVNKIADPIIGAITSFASRGRYDSATLIDGSVVAGDLPGPTGRNPEWFVANEDIQALIVSTVGAILSPVLAQIRANQVQAQTIYVQGEISGENIRLSNKRATARYNQGTRG